jgi:hypothetical protein
VPNIEGMGNVKVRWIVKGIPGAHKVVSAKGGTVTEKIKIK